MHLPLCKNSRPSRLPGLNLSRINRVDSRLTCNPQHHTSILVSVSNYDMKRSSANTLVAFIPHATARVKPMFSATTGLFWITVRIQSLTMPANRRTSLHHYPMPRLLVFGRWGRNGLKVLKKSLGFSYLLIAYFNLSITSINTPNALSGCINAIL